MIHLDSDGNAARNSNTKVKFAWIHRKIPYTYNALKNLHIQIKLMQSSNCYNVIPSAQQMSRVTVTASTNNNMGISLLCKQ